jgi:predicted AAA+ superfamily ATPase
MIQNCCILTIFTVKIVIMREEKQRFRWLSRRLPASSTRRLVVVTGARQTGKTTLALECYPDLRHLNLDAIETREDLRAVRTAAWGGAVGPAVIDEAQKEPNVFEKVKYAYDQGQVDFSVLLGSSRILLMDRVKESLAGRAFLYDLWPLMPGELLTPATAEPPLPLLDALLDEPRGPGAVLAGRPPVLVGDEADACLSAIEHLEQWGGMPELLRLGDDDRRQWLRSYRQTFLERDLADLVRLSDLQPFVKLTRLAMLRTGRLLSYSELARDAGLSPSTAKRYLEYLRISYQTVLLQPYARNLTSSVVKTPKLYWVDPGILRQGTDRRGQPDGELFENLVVVEIHKWIQTMARGVNLTFYRTRSGMEVDLVIDTPHGLLAAEIKSRPGARSTDLVNLRRLAASAGDRWLGGLVIHRGKSLEILDRDNDIWSMPVSRLFFG